MESLFTIDTNLTVRIFGASIAILIAIIGFIYYQKNKKLSPKELLIKNLKKEYEKEVEYHQNLITLLHYFIELKIQRKELNRPTHLDMESSYIDLSIANLTEIIDNHEKYLNIQTNNHWLIIKDEHPPMIF